MTKPLEVAFILAAGRGERLRPLTDVTPKPLLPYRGRPLLDHILDSLSALKLKRVVFNAWHLKEQVVSYVKAREKNYSFEMKVSLEEELLGTAGGLKKAMSLIDAPQFLMLNGDCLWQGDIKSFSERGLAHSEALSTWWLRGVERDQTLIGVKNQKIVQIGSLWKESEPEQTGCFSGIQIIQHLDSKKLPDQGCIVRNFWIPELQRKPGILRGDFDGLISWTDIGTLDRYHKL